ncbi:MAG: L,D-transpeptidase [Myxococcota bacterium]
MSSARRERSGRGRSWRLWLALACCVPLLLAGGKDPGVLIEIDLEDFRVTTRDLRTGKDGPTLPIVIGSPSHPTPPGRYRAYKVIRNPGWKPGAVARSFGATPEPPSIHGPMGVGKLPFAENGEIALHGAADPLLLGKPASLGCARATDADFLRLVSWLEEVRVLRGKPRDVKGELHQSFRRPARVRVR